MIHVVPATRGSIVHALSEDDKHTMCGAMEKYIRVDNVDGKVQVLWPTRKNISCKGCTKALEMVAREQLRFMNGAQLEEIIELQKKFRNGYNDS